MEGSNKKVNPAYPQATAGQELGTRPIRVALIAPSPRAIGGQAAQAQFLLRKWAGDPAVRVRFIASDPQLPPGLSWAEGIPYLRTAFRFPVYLWRLWQGLRDCDVAHIFSASYWSFLLVPMPARVLAGWRSCKAVLHYHSGEASDHLQRWPSAVRSLRKMHAVVVPSEYLQKLMGQFGISARVVANGIDAERFRYRARKPLRPVLVCTRALEPYYRVDLVVRAFAWLREIFPEARLSLVGDGRCEGQIRALVSELGGNGVEFLGAIENEKIHTAYHNCDIYVNASVVDNMPISILEAFACGNVVVSSAAGGIRHLVEHERTGLLSEPGDWQSLAANILRVLRDPALSDRLAENANKVSERYRWSHLRAEWLLVYSSVLGETTATSKSGETIGAASSLKVGANEVGANGRA